MTFCLYLREDAGAAKTCARTSPNKTVGGAAGRAGAHDHFRGDRGALCFSRYAD